MKNLEDIWIEDLQKSLKDAFIVLVGNKNDIDDEQKTAYKRQVTKEEGH